jgi:hypothetical protein
MDFYKVSLSGASGREAVFEQTSASAWLFMSGPEGAEPIARCHVYDTGEDPREGDPPPLEPRFGSGYRVALPVSEDEVEIFWSPEGDAAGLRIRGELVAFIGPDDLLGFSRGVAADCDWAHPFNVELFRDLFDVA